IKKDFFTMLKEADIDRHSRWSDVKRKLDSDPRYKAVESSVQREDWFRDYMVKIKEERRRSRDRSRDQGEDVEDNHKSEGEDTGSDGAEEECEDGEANEAAEEEERERQRRIEESLRKREEEVQRALAGHLRDRDKERMQHKHDEAVHNFNALLADLVRSTDYTWKEAKKSLKKDSRWESAGALDREEKEKLFNNHVENLTKRKREKFRELLEELPDLHLASNWKDLKKELKDDPRYTKFSSSDKKCEREFREYLKDKLVAAKADFRELLKETKCITHRSLKMCGEGEQHQRDILEVLRKDRRYLVLDCQPEERSKILMAYMEELEKRGPPPPPTASEPTRRK
ncbi:Transcription elongation regulator 1, partial [Penaeus vannamei]